MTTALNCTVLNCSDTPLAIAASVTGFYTTAVAIALSLWGWTVLVQRVPAELEALKQEVLNLGLEIALLNADSGAVSKSPDPAEVLSLHVFIDQAITRASEAWSSGDHVLQEFRYGQHEQSGESNKTGEPGGFERFGHSGQSEQSAWLQLGKRLKWVLRGSDKAKGIIKEVAKCRSLLSTCERMLILDHIDRRDDTTRVRLSMAGSTSDTMSRSPLKAAALKKAFANWFDGNPAPKDPEGKPALVKPLRRGTA